LVILKGQLMRIEIALLSAVFAASGALAAVPLTSTFTQTPGTSTGTTLTATALGVSSTATANGSTGIALVPVSQFNPNNGILLGARVTATVPVTLTTVVTGVIAPNGSRRIDSVATYTGAVSAAGVSIPAATSLTVSHFCSGTNCTASASNQTRTVTGSIGGTGTVAAGSLSNYRGTGTVNIATAGTLSSTVTNGPSNVVSGQAQAIVARTAGASYSIAYDYLNFAQASFNGSTVQSALTLDFGTRGLNSGPVTINFSIHNIGNNNSAGLDLLSVNPQTSNPLFTTTLDPFVDLAGGSSRSFSATFDPRSLGSAGDRLRLVFKDALSDTQDGIGARETAMDIYYTALTVLPDPGTWMTMILGFGFIGASMRRHRAMAAA
jgi:hypothetical protein